MDNRKNVLMSVCNYFNPDNRVFRAANSLAEAGYEVVVLSYFKEGLPEEENLGFGFTVKRLKSGSIPFPIKQLRNFSRHLLWRKKAKEFASQFNPEYVHCHDYNTLFLGSFCKRKFRSKVIYDNHEYFQDINYLHRYPVLIRAWIAMSEREALKRIVDEMIVVSPGIAEAYYPLFGRKINIVRNIPDIEHNSNLISVIPDDVTNFLESQRKIGRKLFLYLGTNTQKGRGMDFCFKLISSLPTEYGLVIFGPRDNKELMLLNQKAIQIGIADRFGAFISLPIPSLNKISSNFYMGVSLIEPIYFSYLHSLPNKLFEYFSMGLPVLSSDIPDQAELVLNFKLGNVIPFDINKAKDIIIKNGSNLYNPSIRNLFTWESEKKVLLSVYQSIK